jgi:hypothetical protein
VSEAFFTGDALEDALGGKSTTERSRGSGATALFQITKMLARSLKLKRPRFTRQRYVPA